MFIAACELQKLRQGIAKLYHDRRVVVAPCRCKLYISRSQKVIDVEGKTSPDWNFFANGVTSLIYNPDNHGLLLTLFDVESSRLLWMLKMNENTIVRAPNSTFHIVNTTQDFDEHVGMIYESRDVANLLLNTYELLSQRRQQLIEDATGIVQKTQDGDADSNSKQLNDSINNTRSPTAGTKRTRKNKLLRSLSFHGRNRGSSNKESTSQHERRCRSRTVVGPEDFPDPSLLRCERPTSRPVSSPNAAGYGQTENEADASNDLHAVVGHRFPLSERRSDTSIRFGRCDNHNVIPEQIAPGCLAESSEVELPACSHTSPAAVSPHPTTFARGRLFFTKKVKLTRSQSLKVSRKASDASQCHATTRPNSKSFATDDQASQRQDEASQRQDERERYAKIRVVKPRACSDSLLLHGSAVKCIVDTGNVARKVRERRSLMRALSDGRGATTDLCTTEL